MVSFRTKAHGGIIAFIGYLLSPLSWWNDLVVNIPIAYVIALGAGFFSSNFFLPTLILAYWGTNILGFILIHYGTLKMTGKQAMTKKELAFNIVLSLVYTAIMVFLVQTGILRFPGGYFK